MVAFYMYGHSHLDFYRDFYFYFYLVFFVSKNELKLKLAHLLASD